MAFSSCKPQATVGHLTGQLPCPTPVSAWSQSFQIREALSLRLMGALIGMGWEGWLHASRLRAREGIRPGWGLGLVLVAALRPVLTVPLAAVSVSVSYNHAASARAEPGPISYLSLVPSPQSLGLVVTIFDTFNHHQQVGKHEGLSLLCRRRGPVRDCCGRCSPRAHWRLGLLPRGIQPQADAGSRGHS